MLKGKLVSGKLKAALVVLGIAAVIVAYLTVVHFPVKNGIAEATAEMEILETNNVIYQAKAQKLEAMKAELENIDPATAKEVPAYDNLQNEVAFLNGVLGGTENYQIDFSAASDDSGIYRRSANISFSCGSYAAAKQCIDRLEDWEYLDKVTNLVISPKANSEDVTDGEISVALTVVFYERIA